MKLKQLFLDSLECDNPLEELRQVVQQVILDNTEREVVLSELESIRGQLNEDKEDIVLEVMDFICGFCSPHIRI
jgi:hypothetical protein